VVSSLAHAAEQDIAFGGFGNPKDGALSIALPQTRPMAAAAHMVGAMLILGFVDIYVAVIALEISVWQFLSCRTVLALALVWCMSRAGLGGLKPRRLWAVAVRSLLIATGMVCYFGSLAFMPIAQSLAGLFTSPIWILLISVFVLRQPIGPWRVLALIIGFAGILMVLGMQDGLPGWIMLLPVAGGVFYACGSVATRVWCEDESTVSLLAGILLTQGVLGACALTVLTLWQPMVPEGADGFLLRGWVWPMTNSLHLVALQAVLSVGGVFLLIRAYQIGEASQVSVLEYSIMIFGPFFGWLMMGQVITATQMLGICLIAVSGLVIALRSRG
jgi:drug/metabolite transporter (DMT)-like permease